MSEELIQVQVLSCSFTLYGADAAPVGLCISPVISNIAHDCRPNAQIVFPLGAIANGGMKIVAVESIHPGEEVCLLKAKFVNEWIDKVLIG